MGGAAPDTTGPITAAEDQLADQQKSAAEQLDHDPDDNDNDASIDAYLQKLIDRTKRCFTQNNRRCKRQLVRELRSLEAKLADCDARSIACALLERLAPATK